MARIDNLDHFLTDVASSIKTKKGYQSSQKIAAEDFDTEITSISTIPDGVFVQENTPSKTTQQAIWLKEEDRSNILTTDILLSNLSGSDYTAVNGLLNRLTQAELLELNQYKYISFVYNYMFDSRCWTVYASNTKPAYQNNNDNYRFYYGYVISQESRIGTKKKISPEQYYANYGTPLDIDYIKWILNFDLTMKDGSIHPSDMNDNEQGLYVDINGIRYIINTNKGDSGSSWTKILDTSNANATSGDILTTKSAFVNNTKLNGTMPNNGTINITPSTSSQSIPAGYTSGGTVSAVDSSIDANITQANIRAGVSILGVTGNLEPDKPDQTKTVTPSTSQQVVEPDNGYELSSVTINPVTSSIDANIIAENIKNGVTILGVTGTLDDEYEENLALTFEILGYSDNPTEPEQLMVALNGTMGDDEMYSALGGTEQEIEDILDEVFVTPSQEEEVE